MLRRRSPLMSVIALCALVGALLAASPTTRAAEKIVGPYYNPHTKSYFAYVDTNIMSGRNWASTVPLATGRTYKGVRGRLAVVKDRETHQFLREKFGGVIDKETWIGLRYFCRSRKLLWVDGTTMSNSPAGIWHPRWHRTNITCSTSSIPYMPVYYLGGGASMVWQASGQLKHHISFLVEFPTGKP
jgi:hypothetical protein